MTLVTDVLGIPEWLEIVLRGYPCKGELFIGIPLTPTVFLAGLPKIFEPITFDPTIPYVGLIWVTAGILRPIPVTGDI